MSKLDEVIKQLEVVLSKEEKPELTYYHAADLESILDTLKKLNKPVQYVVEVENRFSNMDHYWFRLTTNNIHVFGGLSLAICKKVAHNRLNRAAELLGLPPITIEQITFVEV